MLPPRRSRRGCPWRSLTHRDLVAATLPSPPRSVCLSPCSGQPDDDDDDEDEDIEAPPPTAHPDEAQAPSIAVSFVEPVDSSPGQGDAITASTVGSTSPAPAAEEALSSAPALAMPRDAAGTGPSGTKGAAAGPVAWTEPGASPLGASIPSRNSGRTIAAGVRGRSLSGQHGSPGAGRAGARRVGASGLAGARRTSWNNLVRLDEEAKSQLEECRRES